MVVSHLMPVEFLAADAELGVVEHQDVDVVLDVLDIDVVAVLEDLDLELRGELLGLAGPDVEHGFRADDERGLFRAAGFPVFFEQPEQIGERLDGFAEAHVIGEDAAEVVDREVGEELEAIDLIGAQGGVEAFRHVRIDLELDVAGAVLDALPGLRVEDLGGLGVGELQGVHAVGLAGEVEGVEPEAGDGLALVGVELDFEAHPRAVVHADVAAAGGDELADLGFGEIDALDVDDDAQVEPVDVLADDLEADGGGDGIGEDGFQAEVDVEFDVLGHRLDPLGEFFRELLGDAGFEREQLLVVGEPHFIEDGGHRIERLAGEAQQLLALDRVVRRVPSRPW
jgi:hypothetical protein